MAHKPNFIRGMGMKRLLVTERFLLKSHITSNEKVMVLCHKSHKAEFNECLLINVIKDIHTSAMAFWGNTCTVNVKGHHSIVIIKKLKHIFVVQLDITNPYLCTALSSDLLQDVFKTRCSVKLLTKLKETPQCTFHKIITPRSLN